MNRALQVLTLCAGAWGCIPTALAFTDPLDQPAIMSERAVNSPLYGLSGSGPSLLVAVGPRGHILHSEDAGKHFSQSPVPLSSDLVAVYFVSPSLGWAVGHDGVILNSKDGGKTWNPQLDGRQMGAQAIAYYATALADDSEGWERAREYAQTLQNDGPTKPLLDVYFENEKEGWAVGAFNLILHTTDAGAHWTPWMDRTDNPNEYSLHAIRKVGDEIFIAGELGLLLRLDRAQQRFIAVEVPYTGSFFGLTGRQGLLVVFGLRGNAWVSRDNGSTWKKLETGTSYAINAGTTLAKGGFILASAGGELLFSDPDGDLIIKTLHEDRTPLYGLLTTDEGLALIGPKGVRIASPQQP